MGLQSNYRNQKGENHVITKRNHRTLAFTCNPQYRAAINNACWVVCKTTAITKAGAIRGE